MSIAGIEKVREAEIQAAQIRKESEEADRKGNETYRAAMQTAETKAEALYQERIDLEAAACKELKSAARENLSRAAETIIGKVVGTYGNS